MRTANPVNNRCRVIRRTRCQPFIGNDSISALYRRVLKASSLALLVKLTGAPVSFLMFFALAQAMSLEEYGRFAFAFSLALVLAKAAALGQPQLMLRLLPGYADAGEKWRAAMRFALRNVGVGGFLAALAMVLGGLFQGSSGYLFAAAPLCLLLAFSELQSSILRTCEKIVWALAPREIVWRSSLILLGLGVWLSPVSGLTAATLFAFASLSLALVLLWQSYADRATRYRTSLDGERDRKTHV